jgi:hypothetical protein
VNVNAADNFHVIAQDVHGRPVCCSYCARGVKHVVVLPITDRPGSAHLARAADGEELWMGLCAYCVLAMAKALARAEEKRP